MDLVIRGAPTDLCGHCRNTFSGVHGKKGKLPRFPSDTCALCRLMLATISRLQALHFKPLRSYTVTFHRLIRPGDVEQEGGAGPHRTPSRPRLTFQASQHEMSVKDEYTESTRKPFMEGPESVDQALKYRTSVTPSRSAVLCTRLPVGMDKAGSPASKTSQHLEMAAAASQVDVRISRIARLCAERHEICGKSLSLAADGSSGAAFPHPIRLVRFDITDGVHKARLVELKENIPPYACLSHRWFGNKQWKTNKATMDSAVKDIPFHSLPKTFQDAAVVAHSLGVHHLWVDSICIIQDDNSDWEQQSTQMGLIFQRCAYALAAIDAFSDGDLDSGLLLARDQMPTEITMRSSFSAQYDRVLPPLASQVAAESQDENEQDDEFQGLSSSAWGSLEYELEHGYTSFDMSVERSSWNSRGWIFQERLLSPRILYFTKEQVFWECAASVVSESTKLDDQWQVSFQNGSEGGKGPGSLPGTNSATLHKLLRTFKSESHESQTPGEPSFTWKEHQSLQLWWRITERYSECTLTFSEDRWFAIAGLCEILQARYGARIEAGIWTVGVGAGLLWHARNTYLRPFANFTAPSWSWLNLDGPVGYAYSDTSYTGCIQKVSPLIESHAFEVKMIAECRGEKHQGFVGRLGLTCPTAWATVSKTKFADFQFREMTGQTTATPAWRYFQSVSAGRSTLELAREYRSAGLPSMTRLLYSVGLKDGGEASDSHRNKDTEPPRAIGWAVLDRDSEPDGPVLCALVLRRDLYGARDAQQQVLECVLLVPTGSVTGADGHQTYRRVGRGRIVERDFLSDAPVETLDLV